MSRSVVWAMCVALALGMGVPSAALAAVRFERGPDGLMHPHVVRKPRKARKAPPRARVPRKGRQPFFDMKPHGEPNSTRCEPHSRVRERRSCDPDLTSHVEKLLS